MCGYTQKDQETPILDVKQVLEEELKQFLLDASDDYDTSSNVPYQNKDSAVKPTRESLELAALCLSGGGIRSAAFCLGVIQSFAARGMLKQFHYLSTVSGGGYIAGWLTRCIKSWNGDVAAAEEHINMYGTTQTPGGRTAAILARKSQTEPPEINRLRRYTNFLTPDPGIGSADTWAGIILWLRNTLINLSIFFPLTLAAAALPALYYVLVCMLGGSTPDLSLAGVARPLFWIALGCLGIANFFVCLSLPTHVADQIDRAGKTQAGISGRQVFCRIGAWSLIWSFLVPLALAGALKPPQSSQPLQQAFWTPKPTAAPVGDICPSGPQALTPAKSAVPPQLANCPLTKPFSLWGRIEMPQLYKLPLLNLVVCIIAYVLATLVSFFGKLPWGEMRVALAVAFWRRPRRAGPGKNDLSKLPDSILDFQVFLKNFPAWIISGCLSSVILLAGIILAYGHGALWISLAGPLWVVGAELLRSTFYVAIRQNGFFSDLDREWLARLSGIKLRAVLSISVFSTAAVFLPRLFIDNLHGVNACTASVATFATGPIAALIGKSALTPFSHGSKSKTNFWQRPEILVGAGATIFSLFIFMLCGRLIETMTEYFVLAIESQLPELFQCLGSGGHGDFIAACFVLTSLFAIFILVAYFVDDRVNLNRFSMHAVYRNRLIRAFLGVARSANYDDGIEQPKPHMPGGRAPDLFTGFDPVDNIRMSGAFKRTAQAGRRPIHMLFPVINVALNTTTGKDTARARRKSEAFTITPLHCGAGALREWKGAYVPTRLYAGSEKLTGPNDKESGITLGTAMAISGAAVSPNMGYNSSPFAAFLMTLFNVRLGAWLPNPGAAGLDEWPSKPKKKFLKRGGPKHAIGTMFDELTGQSDGTSKYIYLSDGGHFDNLGLYEMLRRRCRFIVVVDSGADPNYAYFDLGHVLQTATIDFGVQIQFRPAVKTKQKTLSPYCAFADVTYPPANPGDGAETGQIIYIKPWLPDDAPIELLAYKRIKKEFPFESTANQFFTENDFESYRRLGEYLTHDLLAKTLTENNIKNLFSKSEAKSKKPTPSQEKPRRSSSSPAKPKTRVRV